MILYNVNCHMEQSMASEWLKWMQDVHIPEVMATGCFQSYRILKVLTNATDDEGVNYSIQYDAASMAEYVRYRDQFAPSMQQQTKARYGERVLAFRTLLEVVS
jgi:hypothetical protein